jgi:hypothetical protein
LGDIRSILTVENMIWSTISRTICQAKMLGELKIAWDLFDSKELQKIFFEDTNPYRIFLWLPLDFFFFEDSNPS